MLNSIGPSGEMLCQEIILKIAATYESQHIMCASCDCLANLFVHIPLHNRYLLWLIRQRHPENKTLNLSHSNMSSWRLCFKMAVPAIRVPTNRNLIRIPKIQLKFMQRATVVEYLIWLALLNVLLAIFCNDSLLLLLSLTNKDSLSSIFSQTKMMKGSSVVKNAYRINSTDSKLHKVIPTLAIFIAKYKMDNLDIWSHSF